MELSSLGVNWQDSGLIEDSAIASILNEMGMLPSDFRRAEENSCSILTNFDNLITLHHRKYMKNIDLSLFAWEQRKFGELVDIDNGDIGNTTTKDYSETLELIRYMNTKCINQRFLD